MIYAPRGNLSTELDVCVTVHHQYNDVSNQKDVRTFSLIIFWNQPYMFRATNSSILRSTFLTVYTAFGIMHRHCWRPVPRGTGRQQYRCIVPKAVYTVKKCSWGWANLLPETCRADFKRLIKRLLTKKLLLLVGWLVTSWFKSHLYIFILSVIFLSISITSRPTSLLATRTNCVSVTSSKMQVRCINPYPTAFPYGNGMVLHFYQQQESSTTKTVHKVINKGLKTYV